MSNVSVKKTQFTESFEEVCQQIHSHSSFWPVFLQIAYTDVLLLTPLVTFQNNVITVSEWP